MLRLDRSSGTGLGERVERQGYARRQAAPVDRRAVVVSLAPSGKRVTEAFYDEVSRRLVDLVAALPAADRDGFVRVASKIVLDEAVPAIFGVATA